MAQNQILTTEGARRDTYRLLADFYLLPDIGHLDQLAYLVTLLQTVCSEATDHLDIMQLAVDSQQLQIDHARLFVGPFKLLAPPYGSVYLENKRELMGDSTVEVRKRYQRLGLDLSKDHLEAPDHVATELEFMHFLIFQHLEALVNGDPENALGLVREQKDFLEQHLGYWAPAFTALVEEHATTGFYQGLARVTRAFLQHDLHYLIETVLPYLDEVTAEGKSHDKL